MVGLGFQPSRSACSGWVFPALAVALALVAGACGIDDPAATVAETTQPSVTTTTTTAVTTSATTLPRRFEGQLAGLTVIDENTFTVELVEADPEFPLRLGSPSFFASPDSAFEDPATQNEMPIGNGPFMMARPWEHGLRITAIRNPDYRGSDPAKVDTYEWVFGKSPEAAFSDVLAGELDIAPFPLEEYEEFVALAKRTLGEDNVKRASLPVVAYIGFPTYLEEYTAEHRRALSMAIDRRPIAESGTVSPAHSVVPPAVGGRPHVCENWDYHPEEARELWNAAGPLDHIDLWSSPGFGEDPELVASMWSETLGIDPDSISLETHEWGDYLSILDAREATGPIFLGWGQDYPSPLNFLEPLYASSSSVPEGSNATVYDNPDFDAALAAGKASIATSGRLEEGLADYLAAEDILCEDTPTVPVYFGARAFVHSDNVSEVYKDAYLNVGYTLIEAENGIVREHLEEPGFLFYTGEAPGVALNDVVIAALNTGLIRLDPQANQPENAHAHTITSEDGGQTWTIVLKPGWTFHDGTPNDAASYVKTWSYWSAILPSTDGRSFFGNIVGYDELSPAPDEG